jgi:hypothetical protein
LALQKVDSIVYTLATRTVGERKRKALLCHKAYQFNRRGQSDVGHWKAFASGQSRAPPMNSSLQLYEDGSESLQKMGFRSSRPPGESLAADARNRVFSDSYLTDYQGTLSEIA